MKQGYRSIAISALAITTIAIGAAELAAQPPRGGFGRGFGVRSVVTGEPYTASATSTSVDKLADGTTITHNSTIMEARDAQGRTVRAVTETPGNSSSAVTRTTVMDPVAHTLTNWSTQSTVATVLQLPDFRPRGNWSGPGTAPVDLSRGPRNGGRSNPNVTRVTLPAKTIAGVTAEGVKTTITIPAGAEGNDKPLVSTREVWTSTNPKLLLLEISDSPRNGLQKMEVTSLSLNDPDPTLFRPPSNYTVRQQTRHQPR